MKITAIADAYVTEEFYENVFKKFPEFELANIVWFGPKDKRGVVEFLHTLERGGAEAIEAPAELTEAVKESDAILTHLCPIQKKLIENSPNLKYILSCRGGVENINMEAATTRKIPVLNNPAHNANSVAEFTVGMMLAETRHIARLDRAMRNGLWRSDYPIQGGTYELFGKTIGLIGFGTISRLVAKMLRPFECNIIVYDLFPIKDAKECGITQVDLDYLLQNADIVSLHARSEKAVLTADKLDLLKETAYLINTARPHLLDEEHLIEMLENKRIAGAALDVFMQEPINADSPFLKLDNVTITNHVGGCSVNCFSDAPLGTLRDFQKLLRNESPRFCANRKELNIQ